MNEAAFDLSGRVKRLDRCDDRGDRWVGEVVLLGVSFHVDLVRVESTRRSQCVPAGADRHTWMAYQAMQRFYHGVYQTVEIPGLDGEYAMFIHPFCV